MPNEPALPFVSVIVIVLNGASTMEACLNALTTQTYPKDCYEVVVVDNGSTDGTLEIARRFPVRLEHEPCRGYAPARNTGVKAAQGEIIAFTDSDCLAEPNWLAELIKPFGNPQIGIVGGDIKPWEIGSLTLVEQFIDQSGFASPPHDTKNGVIPFITTTNVAYRKSLIEQAGYFNPRLFSCEDVDLSRKAQTGLKARAVMAPSALVHHRLRNTLQGLYKQSWRNGHGEILMATRWKDVEPFHTSLAAELRHMLRQFFALFVYLASFIYRSVVSLLNPKKGLAYRMHPRLWLIAEGATLLGKVQGLIDTHFLQQVPLRPEERR